MIEKPIRILLVENDTVDRMALDRYVRKQSLPYVVDMAETVSQALERLKKPDYQLILLDYLLTDGTGLEIFQKAADIPVIVITGHGNEDIAVEAMRQGAYDYIIKDHSRNYLRLIPTIVNDALERKRAKNEKAESDKRYKTIVETVSDVIFQLDIDQKIVYVNPAIRDLGYDPASVIGQSIVDFVCQEDLGKVGLIATRRVGARATRNLEVRFVVRGGTTQWIELKSISVLLDSYGLWSVSDSVVQTPGTEKNYLGTLCIGRNITKRKQAEEALRESETRVRAIMDNVADAIITFDSQGVIQSFNLAGEGIFGYLPSEVMGSKFSALVVSDKGNKGPGVTGFESGSLSWFNMKSCELTGRRKDGSLFPMELSITKVELANQALFIGIIRDITSRKLAEEKLNRATTELKRSNMELQSFASIASHDLQEPLRKIIVFGDRLRSTVSEMSSESNDYLQRMQKSARRMQDFIDDLLLYSKVSRKEKFYVRTDLNAVIKEVLENLELKIAQTKGAVNVVSLPSLHADPFQMVQLFQNLVSNALKFYKKDVPPVVSLSSRRDEKGHWEIKLADNGIGFDEKYAERIFMPFERLHARSTYEGTGMGLAICQKIVHQHNGEIRVTSGVSQGTTFFINLPENPLEIQT